MPPSPRSRSRPRRPTGGIGVPSWLSVALIAALILGGLTMIAIGLTKEDEQQPAGGAQPAQPAPAEGQQDEAAPAEGTAPQQGAAVPLDRRRFAQRFEMGVPRGWQDGLEDGGVALTAPGSTAEIVVFFQEGEAPEPQLASAAQGFLQQRHSGAQVGAPRPTRIGRQRALRIVATYQGGEEVAVVISAKGASYVVMRRVDRGASPDLAQQADAALASFKPL